MSTDGETRDENPCRIAVIASTLLRMKRIGLLGGMSWESTTEYYSQINRGVAAKLGGLHSADLVMVSFDFTRVTTLQAEDRWDEAAALLAGEAKKLEAAGAEAVLICTNTMHKVADEVQAAISVPLLHLADAIARAAKRVGATRVGLLGTAFTMEQDFYRDRLEANGLEVSVPEADDRAEVHRIIFDEICQGKRETASRERLVQIANALIESGAEAIILGCTELELLLDPDESPDVSVPLLPTARLHAAEAVAFALGED